MKSQGVGDSIEKMATKSGLKTLTQLAANAMGKKDCGCDKRKDWLNKKFPYNNK